MKKLHLFTAIISLLALSGGYAGAAEYDVLTPLKVEGSYAVFQGTAEVQGNLFSVGGSTLSVQYGKIGVGTSAPAALLHISSAAGVGGDLVLISTGASNVIRMTGAGEIYANKFYGDISGASGLPPASGDNLGSHIATTTLNMANFDINNVSTVTVSTISLRGSGAGIAVTSHVYVSGDLHAVKIYGDVSGASGLPSFSGDSLGTHVATQTLNMASFNIANANYIAASSAGFTQGVTASSFTATGIGVGAAQVKFADNVLVSSEASAALGGGINVSTNIYIVGFSSAAKYYGDGSSITGIAGTLSGGQTPKLPYWTAANVLGNSTLSQDSAASLTALNSTFTVQGSAFSVGGSTLTVSDGKVGIGVAAPDKPFEVKNTGTTFKVDTGADYGSLYINGVEMVRMRP